MDPRRVWELNEAAAKGAARRAAADAAQRSVQGALRSERGEHWLLQPGLFCGGLQL